MTHRTLLVATLVGSAAAFSPALAESWDMPTPYPEATFHTQNIMQFADTVREATNGDLDITVHPAGSLYEHPEIKNAVRKGLAPIGEVLISRLSNEDPIFAADVIPFLAAGYDDSRTLYDATKDAISEKLAEQGLTFLYAVPWPPQGLYTKTDVTGPSDLSGLKMRTYNATMERLANLLGATPTQVEVPDLPTAFSTGRVEAMITSPSTGANSKAWDFLSNYYDTKAWLPKNMVIVNTRTFEALPTEQQDAVKSAAADAETRGWDLSMKEAEEKTKELADNGIAVAEPSEELQKAFNDAGATMSEEWAAEAGEPGQAALQALGVD